MTVFRVATIPNAPAAFDRDATLAKVRTLTAEAARTGAKLVLFPKRSFRAIRRALRSERTLAVAAVRDDGSSRLTGTMRDRISSAWK